MVLLGLGTKNTWIGWEKGCVWGKANKNAKLLGFWLQTFQISHSNIHQQVWKNAPTFTSLYCNMLAFIQEAVLQT